MFSRLREHFGTAGLVVAIVALVAALGGGAYAATGGSSGGKATASAKQGKQGKQGKPGKTGPAGPQGPAGPTGPAAPAAPAGAKGDTGATGPAGATGPTGATGATGPAGKDGTTGFTETLPSGKTETGVWWFQGNGSAYGGVSPISFPIPLTKADAEGIEVKYWQEDVAEDPECTGDTLEPKAEPGVLCIYSSKSSENNTAPGNPQVFATTFEEPAKGVGTSGALLYFFGLTDTSHVGGSFAVTAPLGS
jgi:hypothetical protein